MKIHILWVLYSYYHQNIIRSCWVYRSFWVHPARQDGGRVTSQSKRSFPIQCIEISGTAPLGLIFWRLCAFSQNIKQLWTKNLMDLVRNVPRNSKITVLLQQVSLLWSYSEKCAKINILHVLNHKSITTWVSEIPVQLLGSLECYLSETYLTFYQCVVVFGKNA